MPTLNPYLNFNGNAEEAFNFYKSVFGGEFIGGISRFKDTPDGAKMPAADGQKVMHVALPIGKGNILVATDAMESMGQKVIVGNNFYLSLEADSKEEATRLFNTLATDGKIEQALQDTFWGAYFGMFADRFGVKWMISYTYKK